MICNVVFNPFSSMVLLPLHNTAFPIVLEDNFYNEIPFLSSTTCATGDDLNHSPRRLTQCEQYVNMLMLLLIFKCEIPCLIYELFVHPHLAILSSQCRSNIGDIVRIMLRFI